jgi:hypothetical protein
LEQGYTGLFWEQNREYSFFTHIWGYPYKESTLKKN